MKTAGRAIGTALCLALTGALVGLAKTWPGFLFAWYPALSRHFMARLGAITAVCPLSVAEIGLGLIILWALFTFVRMLRGKSGILRWLTGLTLGLSILVLFFVASWGLNFFDPTSLADRLELPVSGYTQSQLQSAAEFYLARANDYSDQIPRDEEGRASFGAFRALAEESGQGYDALAAEYPFFLHSENLPKPVIASRLMSYCGITGIFSAFTGEANLNTDTPDASLPYTMAHERAHAQAVCPEDECNFAAYLACEASDSAALRYSGYYSAFVYCYNALHRVNAQAAAAVWAQMSPGVEADARYSAVHYAQYEGKTREAAEKVNDTYLKTFQQEEGVQSYDAVTTLLIAWYLSGRAE